jgi:acyl carrier protein
MSFSHEEIEKRTKEVIADKLSTSVDQIKGDSNIYNDLGADSLDGVIIVMALEDEFDIEIPDSECWDWQTQTLDKIVSKLEELISKK